MMVIALETLQRVLFGGRRLTKNELERVHLEKYRSEHLLATGVLPFDPVREEEAPDFIVGTSAGEKGIECVAFALEKRRHAYALFDDFKAKLRAETQRSPLSHRRIVESRFRSDRETVSHRSRTTQPPLNG